MGEKAIKRMMGFIAVLAIVIAGCDSENISKDKKADNPKILGEILEKDNESEFSYLQGLTNEEVKAYKTFLEDQDAKHLSALSPESALLVYIHSAVIGDIETIYTLTQNGTNGEFALFKENFYGKHHKQFMETALEFRYYDSVEVKKDEFHEEDAMVEIGVSYGLFHAVNRYGLKKEEGIWKLELQPL